MRTRRAGRLRTGVVLTLLAALWLPSPAARSAPQGDAAALAALSGLRDAFIRRIDAEGYHPCPAPAIELGDPPNFGRYDRERNTLVIASWGHLAAPERRSFEDMAQGMGGSVPAEAMFENGTYRWVIVHELGHWWQSCRQQARPESYAAENGANRIALAFWREHDPRYALGIVTGFRALLESAPSPLPEGVTPEAYLDEKFARVAESEEYTWFQAEMIVALAHESPPPSFHKALSQPLYPY